MFRVYNEIIPLNDNYEIADEVSLTILERLFRVGDIFKECFKYLSYLYKIYEYVKTVLYYIYCFFSIIFFALCCFLTILLVSHICRGAKNLFYFLAISITKKLYHRQLPFINLW
jgi:hypothetical protein